MPDRLPSDAEGGELVSYLDVLVPPAPDPRDLVERLRQLGVRDAGKHVHLGPLDDATLHLIRLALTRTSRNLTLELPRGKHDLAVMIGIYVQLMRLGGRMRGPAAEDFSGPVVVVGLNTNLTERLKRIRIANESLSEALRAQRIRSDGSVIDLSGTISPAHAWSDGLLYLNTSLGWPPLPGVRPGVVVIDRGSFRNPETLERALVWCQSQNAGRIIVLNPLGDVPPKVMADATHWLRWSWTPGLRDDVRHELGCEDCCGPLSTNPLLEVPVQPIGAAVYSAPKLSQLRRRCLGGIAAARKTRQPFPKQIADAVSLVNLLGGLWSSVTTANVWAVADGRGVSVATLMRSLRDARSDDLRGPWDAFRETQWSDLRRNALALAELMTEYNPRLDVLAGVLDWAAANRPDTQLAVRTGGRTAAGALLQDLLTEHPRFAALTDEQTGRPRLAVLPYSDKLPWTTEPAVEFHVGVPAPWRRSALLSGEASEQVVVVDADERAWLDTVVSAVDGEWSSALAVSAEVLRLATPPARHLAVVRTVFGPLAIDGRGEDEEHDEVAMPKVDLPGLFAAFSSALALVEQPGAAGAADTSSAGGRPILARPITLEPGDRVYWLPCDAQVEVLAGTRYSTIPVAGLTAGVSLVLPRGESRDALYTRLLLAAHQDVDVMAVELLLRQFRRGMRELHDREGGWDGVARALRHRGSTVQSGGTCRLWATGDVIAPEDPEDIRRVARMLYDDHMIVDGSWRRVALIAAELRRLHRELGRLLSAAIGEVASGRSGPNLQRLSEVCGGIDPAEILEEFEVHQIRHVGAPTSVLSGQLRRLLPASALVRPA